MNMFGLHLLLDPFFVFMYSSTDIRALGLWAAGLGFAPPICGIAYGEIGPGLSR